MNNALPSANPNSIIIGKYTRQIHSFKPNFVLYEILKRFRLLKEIGFVYDVVIEKSIKIVENRLSQY